MSEAQEIEFRLKAAARVLERAANKTSDPKLREKLLEFAKQLRNMPISHTDKVRTINQEREKTFQEIVEEIRKFIWREQEARIHGKNDYLETLEDPLKKLEQKIDLILESFEEKLRALDKVLEVIIPI